MHKDKIINAFKIYLNKDEVNLEYQERFLGGMSNYTYHVKVNGKDYVIRIANKEGKVFVDYATEKLHLFLLEPFNITSKTLFYDTDTGIKISEYIPGDNLTATLSAEDYAGVARALHKLHDLNIEGVDYGQIDRLARYESLVEKHLTPEYFELKAFWMNENSTTYKDADIVFTHGDAQRTNIVKNDDSYTLVDFEFAGMNDRYFDIASFGNINFSDSLNLLDYYLGRKALPHEVRRVKFHRLFQVLQWHVVALQKHLNGQSEKLLIDFKKYSDNYLAFAAYLATKIKALPIK